MMSSAGLALFLRLGSRRENDMVSDNATGIRA